jgi:hypothetical protein
MMEESFEGTDAFDKRLAALETAFGPSADVVLHAPIPFDFGYDAGGRADVVLFRQHIKGTVYATCDLMGRGDQMANALGAYELAVCHRHDEVWGAEVISALAYYTLEARVEPGQTMDLGPSAPKGSRLTAFLFDAFATFEMAGQRAGVLLCIGITSDELAACRRGRRERVLKALKSKGVYPFTDPGRRSVLGWF